MLSDSEISVLPKTEKGIQKSNSIFKFSKSFTAYTVQFCVTWMRNTKIFDVGAILMLLRNNHPCSASSFWAPYKTPLGPHVPERWNSLEQIQCNDLNVKNRDANPPLIFEIFPAVVKSIWQCGMVSKVVLSIIWFFPSGERARGLSIETSPLSEDKCLTSIMTQLKYKCTNIQIQIDKYSCTNISR